MGFALPLEWADAGSVRATTRFEADHAAAGAGRGSPTGPPLVVGESPSQAAQGASVRRERVVGLCDTSREGHLRVAAGGRSQPLFTTGSAKSVAAWAGSPAAAQLVPKIV